MTDEEALFVVTETNLIQATSENPGLCVTLPRQNAHLPYVNSAFVSVASLDFEVFGGCLGVFGACLQINYGV